MVQIVVAIDKHWLPIKFKLKTERTAYERALQLIQKELIPKKISAVIQ